jgi:hypothetical protein
VGNDPDADACIEPRTEDAPDAVQGARRAKVGRGMGGRAEPQKGGLAGFQPSGVTEGRRLVRAVHGPGGSSASLSFSAGIILAAGDLAGMHVRYVAVTDCRSRPPGAGVGPGMTCSTCIVSMVAAARLFVMTTLLQA